MAGPELNIIEQIRGKRTHDIELPPEGPADPNLPPKPIDQLRKAFDAGNKIATASDPLEGLRQAGQPKR